MIHQFILDGYHIVLDVYSGSIHVVDEVAYEVIGLFECCSHDEIVRLVLDKFGEMEGVDESEIRDCIADVEALIAQGKLFAKDAFTHVEGFDFRKTSPVLKAMCLHVAHTCNLNCSYCFARQGNYKGNHAEALMSFEVGKQALDYLIRQSGSRVNLEVDFFGGEPLLNWQVVKELVLYARTQEPIHNKNFRFTLTTNGVLVDDDVIDFANREMHNVVLSMDGRKEINDLFRKNFAGEGSYEKIVPKFKEFVEKRRGEGYYMRGTYTRHNLDFTQDIFHMADLGFTELSMEPVVAEEDDPCALTMADIPKLFDEYEILAREMLRRNREGGKFTFYHYMMDLTGGPCLHKRVSGCGSGTEYMAVTPWGELFPCHQFVNDPEFSLGNVWEGVKVPEVQERFKSINIYANPDCRDCWAKLYCAGGCAANAFHATGNINGTYELGCTLFKKRVECAVMMQIAQLQEV